MAATNAETPEPTTDEDWADRLRRSRLALKAWTWEAKLAWADREMTRTIAETEIGVLRYFAPLLPDALQPDLSALRHDWDELRLSLIQS
ncbi:MAG: hypothetical protein Q8L54_08135 [Devosia sp.]|nr:hypothetical protein [Devosia sp.]